MDEFLVPQQAGAVATMASCAITQRGSALAIAALLLISGLTSALAQPTEPACERANQLYEQALTLEARQSVALLRRAITLCPTFEEWYILGRRLMEIAEPSAAADAFRQAEQLAADNRYRGLALGRLAQAQHALGQSSAALASGEQARQLLAPAPPTWLMESLATLESSMALMSAEAIAGSFNAQRGSINIVPTVNLRIHFDFDSATLNAVGKQQAQELGKALATLAQSTPQQRFLLIGHTDLRGDSGYNQELSARRAQAVQRYLETQFPALQRRVESLGRGEEEPRYSGDGEREHALNRRVEVQLR